MRTLATLAALAVLAAGCSLVNDPDDLEPGVDATIPPVPQGLGAVAGKTWVTLQWTPVDVADLDGYAVYAGTVSGDLAPVAEGPDPSAVVSGLVDGVPYYFAVRAVDRTGNASELSAEASATPDDTPPAVAFDPANGASGVNVNTHVVLTFSEPMIRASVQGAFVFSRTDAGPVPAFTWSWDTGDEIAIVSFVTTLAFGKSYTATVGAAATDVAGNALVPASATFASAAAPDTTRPTVVSTVPAAAATGAVPETTISITFSEAMNQSLTQTAFQLLTVAGADAAPYRGGVFTWSNGGKTLTYDPPTSFPNGVLVTYSVGTGACDLAPAPGPNYLASAYNGSFRVAYQKTVTITSDATFDGFELSTTTGITINATGDYLIAGDASNRGQYKAWVSFPHTLLTPTPTRILSATASLYQLACYGSPYTDLDAPSSPFKCFESLFNDCDVDLLLRHVEAGATLTVDDFGASMLRSIGELTETDTAGWRSRSVTVAVQDDRTAARGHTQLRVEFPVASDGDAVADYCWFASGSYASDAALRPKLEVTFETATP